MSVIFDYIFNIFDFVFTGSVCYSLSLALFLSFLTLGCVSIIILGCIKDAKNKSMRWLFYVYQGGYILDLCIAVCEYEFFGEYYKNITSAFLTCTVRFGFLMVVYGLVCAYKMVLNREVKYEEQSINPLNIGLNVEDYKTPIPEKSKEVEKIEDFECLNSFQNKEKGALVDLNVAFIDQLVQSLLAKDLTDEERELCFDIIYDIKNLPSTMQTDRVKKLNGNLQKLIKKAVQYNLAC